MTEVFMITNIQRRDIKSGAEFCRKESGIALLASLFALTVLSLLGLAIMLAASTEVLININYKASRAGYFAAEAGTEEARYRIGNGAGANAIVPPANTATAIYIRANTSIDPTSGTASSNKYYDPEYFTVTKRDSSGNQTSSASGLTTTQFATTIQGTSNQVPYAWVRITQKTENLAAQNVDNDSTNNSTSVYYGANTATGVTTQYVRNAANSLTHNGNPVYLLTSLAIEPNGTQRKIQTEVVVPPPEAVNAAVDSYENVSFRGNLNIDGRDECYGNSGGVVGVKSHGTVDNPNGSQHIYGVPVDIQASAPWIHDVPTIINSLKNSSSFHNIDSTGTNVTCTGSPVACSGSNVNLGTFPNGLGYYYSPGDLDISSNGSAGAGILLVNGNITFHGGFSYTGIIICSGTINFTGGGSDDVNIHGAVIAGDSINDTTSDVGGSINIHYNSCDISTVYNNLPMTILTFKDRAIY
jgi:Tfp pilus assembly protein PilX